MYIDKKQLIKYSYYDEDKHIYIINKNYLCVLLGADKVLFEEPNDRITQEQFQKLKETYSK